MKLRLATLIVGAIEVLIWLMASGALFGSLSDPATKGLDRFAGIVITVLFFLTVVPALVLAWRGVWIKLAFALAMVFPAVFTALFVVAVIAFR